MVVYNKNLINSLNKDINKNFKNIKIIKENYNITYNSISRMVMLDRYSQKDSNLKTLKIGDLVLVVIKDDSKFPTRGIGYVKAIKGDEVSILLKDEEYIRLTKNGESTIVRNKNSISKPLELFYEQIAHRVGYSLSEIEKTKADRNKYGEIFSKELSELNLIPAGRILYGSGSNTNVTYFNCFVLPMIKDSRKGIASHREEVMEIMSRGGGVGTNGSTLRPKNSIAKSVGGKSSGSISWLNDIAKLTNLVEQGGSRRGAQMIMLSDWHPDIIQFVVSKMQNIKILKWLKENSKDKKILEEVESKIEFIEISEMKKKMYKGIVDNEKLFDKEIVDNANRKLKHNGKWRVVDPEFLSGANISVNISDDFMNAIKNNRDWKLRYPDLENMSEKQKQFYDDNWDEIGDVREWEKLGYPTKTYHTMKSTELWNLISFCANYSAEPGIFFIDTANKMTNASVYDQKVVATNPCGEQPLAPYSVCNLSALNLTNFVNKQTGDILWEKLNLTIINAIRMQDNVIDSTPYFLEKNKSQALGERRIGLGVMGLHDMLIWAGIKYGSNQSINFLDKLFEFIANSAYDASAELAKEKGSFKFLTKDKYKKMSESNFVKKLKPEIRNKILKTGIRNSHLLTIAPTGSTGTMVGVSTGLEPYFALKFFRSGRLGENVNISIKIVQEWLEQKNANNKYDANNLPSIFDTAMTLTPNEHINVQNIIQKWIDSSISKTVNAPKGYTVKKVEEIYMKLFEGGAKGGTVYVDGSRDSQVLTLDNKDSKNKIEITAETKTITEEKAENIDASLRSDRQDRKIGNSVGDICPLCKEGTLIDAGGCTMCPNCNSQLKCEI